MSEKWILKSGLTIFVIFLGSMLANWLLQKEYEFDILAICLILMIITCLFSFVTYFMYCSKRNKNCSEKCIEEYFLNVLEENDKYVCRKNCNEGFVYFFQYTKENGQKKFVSIKTSYTKIENIEDTEKPFLEIIESLYIPNKKGVLDHLYYSQKEEDEIKIRYVLHVNEDMIFNG